MKSFNNKSILEFRQFFDKDSASYTYLVFDSKTKAGIIIDPVREQFVQNLKYINEIGIELKFIIETHVHADHVTSAGTLRNATGAKIVYGLISEVECADILINDGDYLDFGRFRIRAISTPGHTDSCTSFYTEGRLFTGDTLLITSCGRTDFQEGDPTKLFESITKKLYSFPEDTLVFPGHDYFGRTVSSIKEEKDFNKRVNSVQTLKNFIKIMNNLELPKPRLIDEAVKLNLRCGYT